MSWSWRSINCLDDGLGMASQLILSPPAWAPHCLLPCYPKHTCWVGGGCGGRTDDVVVRRSCSSLLFCLLVVYSRSITSAATASAPSSGNSRECSFVKASNQGFAHNPTCDPPAEKLGLKPEETQRVTHTKQQKSNTHTHTCTRVLNPELPRASQLPHPPTGVTTRACCSCRRSSGVCWGLGEDCSYSCGRWHRLENRKRSQLKQSCCRVLYGSLPDRKGQKPPSPLCVAVQQVC